MPAGFGADSSQRSQMGHVVWRIFGEGESPLKGRSSYQLIRPLVQHHVAVADRHSVIREIHGWFESHEDRNWLRPEMREQVATVIMDGVGPANQSETAVWAIGSINAELAASMLRSNWSASAIDGFVHATIGTLKTACDRNKVLDPSRGFGLDLGPVGTEVPVDAFVRRGRITTFQNLLNQGLRFVIGGLHPAVENLIELSVALRPQLLGLLVESLEHPVVQAKAVRCAVEAALPSNHRATLDWIRAESCPALVALAIVHSLETVNALDRDLRFSGREDMGGHMWATELRPPEDDLDAAAAHLLAGLADSLSRLEPRTRTHWIGELLSAAPRSLRSHSDDKPLRIQQLETACTEALVRLFCQSGSSDLPEILSAALRIDPHGTWTRHLGDLAWALRESAPNRAADVAWAVLRSHEAYVDRVLEHNLRILDWRYWDHREWIDSLGTCLAVADPTLDLPKWVTEKCQALPLSVWDADAQEDHQSFNTAERIARHWFLVAFHAIPRLKELGREVAPARVLSLIETLCDHCRYAQPYVVGQPASSVAAEFAARCAVEFGDPSEQWLLHLARHPATGARIIWAVIDQRRLKIKRVGDREAGPRLDDIFVTELASIASDRFADRRRWGFDTLEYWGRLSLMLEMTEEAERTALAILAFPARLLTRGRTILALKLLALVAGKDRPQHPIRDRVRSLYGELWSVFTPEEERLDREQVDALMKGLPRGLSSSHNGQ